MKKILKDASEIIDLLLKERGIDSEKKKEIFFSPTKEDLYDPFLMPGVEGAVKRILLAKKKKQKVVVFGDYDVDGVCSTYILWDYLYRELGIDVTPFIPSRFDDGYGMNEDTMRKFQKEGVDLVVTVDCGIKDQELIAKFPEMEFIVTDHHTIDQESEKRWEADSSSIVVHPKLKNSKYPFSEICATAVVYKLVQALAQTKEDESWDRYLEFVALATVCDVMPLVDENRIFVKLGMEAMAKTENVGLQELIRSSSIKFNEIQSYMLGFVFGPKINAAGRLGNALDAVRLFATKSPVRAQKIAQELGDLNKQRQELTITTLTKALEQISGVQEQEKLMFVYDHDWHEGVIGLVAGKLMEQYNRPIICATIIKGKVTGSARSISAYNITEAITTHSSLLERFGGHAQAAGFSLDKENLDKFKKALQKIANEIITDNDIKKKIHIDFILPIEILSMELLEMLERFEPFGIGNPRPIFQIDDLKVQGIFKIGREGKHIKLILISKTGERIEALGFNMAERFENVNIGDRMGIVGNLDINRWNGQERIQMKLKDYKKR